MVKTKRFIYAKRFDGMPKESDFELKEETLPDLKNGEFLTEAISWTVDPYMRPYSEKFPLGITMFGGQVAKIIESKNPQFPVGSYVCGNMGWQTHSIVDISNLPLGLNQKPYIVPELKKYPMSLYLGILGMPGNTAYFGFVEVCQPKRGDTVVISTGAGAVGSHVGQIAKILGCTVIGITGSDEKGEWIKSLGFDDYINYKTVGSLEEALKKKCPKGIDVYFDNVGGEMSSTVIYQMNKKGRIGCCGSICTYNNMNDMPKATQIQTAVVEQQLRMQGLHSTDYYDRWMEGIKQNKEWLEAGKLKYREHIFEGFNNLPSALIGILKGDNIGKAIVNA